MTEPNVEHALFFNLMDSINYLLKATYSLLNCSNPVLQLYYDIIKQCKANVSKNIFLPMFIRSVINQYTL